jgi:ribosomal protein S18 acetylase RimI-like enzyme
MQIKPYSTEDESAVVGIWHRAGKIAYPFLPRFQALTVEAAREVFRETIAVSNDIWVAVLDGRIVGFLAMQESYIDRLYIDPPYQRRGVGTQLLDLAKRMHPDGLKLHTHQENQPARVFYEKHGFVAIRFGVSPPPESVPDVEYRWAGTAGEGDKLGR